MTPCGVGIFDFLARGFGGLRSLSDTQLEERRERLRQQYVSARTVAESSRLYDMLHVFDVEMTRRANEAYERENPNPPERRHREHGWYLPNDE